MNAFILAAALAAATSTPVAESPEECYYVSGMFAQARVYVLTGVGHKAEAILSQVYLPETYAKWGEFIIRQARVPSKSKPLDTAKLLYQHCTSHAGNVDGFFKVTAS